jgi:methylase of polypeptide subunit release factors
MSVDLPQLESRLEKTIPSREGIMEFLGFLGYPMIPEKEQLLDSDVLLQQKDMRERVIQSHRLFTQKAQWLHPTSKQTFDIEASIMLLELKDEQTLRSRWPFEITRYVVKFGLGSTQALFFFVAPGSRSFVVSAYTQSLDVPERIQVRRLVVDVDNVARTDVESLAELFYSLMAPTTIIERFKSALPYLKVGQAFFKEYHNLFQIMSKRLLKVFGSNAKADAYGYAQRLLGRIAFLYFLQRKGWLDKDRAYLKKRAKRLDGKKLVRFLYELFNILNTEGYEDKSKGVIPYLNGSLFEKEPYSQAQMKQLMDACAPCVRDVLNVFDHYNFTISESTPLDKEVAVDPELLGSLFESMLPDSERGDKGTFYTHQEEMLFMAREALRVHLSRFPNLLTHEQVFYLVYGSELGENQKIEPKVAREVKDVIRQIKILDPAVGSGGFLMAALQTILDIRLRLNGIIGAIEQAYDMKLETTRNNLFGVDIENEAIELARLRLWLALVVDEPIENVRPLPNLDHNLHQGDTLKIPEFEKRIRQTKITVDPAIRSALLKQIAATREEYSSSHGKAKETLRVELEGALRKLLELETGVPQPKILPFSYKFFFADVMASGGFDAVLMNPPYIQQEDIGKLPGQNPDTYKSEIAHDAELLTDNNFSPNKQSDISVYFHIRTLSLLREGGAAVVIATNKWLDTRYGVALQEYLLKHSCIDLILDSTYRSFSADVNTVITVIRRTRELVMSNIVRFVCFKIPFENVSDKLLKEIISSNNEGLFTRDAYRLVVRTQEHLYEDGVSEEESSDDADANRRSRKIRKATQNKEHNQTYVGTKWGNLHLRAPPIYYEILRKAGDRLRPLGKIYRIMRGVTSGNIDFFVLAKIGTKGEKLVKCRNGFGHEFLLERDFCKPVLRDPEDVSSYYLEADDISYHLFLCRSSRARLKGTHALDYINWAETSPDAMTKVLRGKNRGKLVRIKDLATVKSRQEWYQLPDVKPSKILVPIIIKNRHVVPLCDDYVWGTNNYHLIYCEDKLNDLWLYLNSSIFRLFMELNGRWEGAGALQMMVYEYKQCPGLDPLPLFSQDFKRLEQFKSRVAHRFINIAEQGPLELEQEDRKELDDSVLVAIGFKDREEREMALKEIHSWLLERVRERLEKPKTAPESVAKAIGKKRVQTDLREFQ